MNKQVFLGATLVINRLTGKRCLSGPFMIFSKSGYLISHIKELISSINIKSSFVMALILLESGIAAVSLYQLFMNYKEARDSRRDQHSLKNGDELIYKSLNCISCAEKIRDVVMLPCKHLAYCHLCFDQMINSNKCPICKKVVVGHKKIFIC